MDQDSDGKSAGSKDSSEMEGSENNSESDNMTPPLPDENEEHSEPISHTSTISEHLDGSIENDRSFQEIEVSHIPSNLSLILQNNNEEIGLTQENISLNSLSSFDTVRNVQIIIESILNTDKFHSATDSEPSVSLNIFDGVNLDDSSINNYVSRLRNNSIDMNSSNDRNTKIETENFKQVFSGTFSDKNDLVKDYLESGEAVQVNLEQEFASNQSTSLNTYSTEYKNALEEYENKILEFETSVSQRDAIINKLTNSLHNSVESRDKLMRERDVKVQELILLREELSEITESIKQSTIKCKKCEENSVLIKSTCHFSAKFAQTKSIDFEKDCFVLEECLPIAQVEVFKDLKCKINLYIQEKIAESEVKSQEEIKILKDQIESEKSVHDTEMNRMRDLLSDIRCGSSELIQLKGDLDAKHKKEMEDLRTYFEKKCADVEKNYSEEIFSQQSRKLSNSSSGGSFDMDMPSDVIAFGNRPIVGPGGDTVANLTANYQSVHLIDLHLQKSDIELIKNELNTLQNVLDKYSGVKDLKPAEFDKLQMEICQTSLETLFKANLSGYKDKLEHKYKIDLSRYERKFNKESSEHEKIVESLVHNYEQKLANLRIEASRNVTTAIQEVASSGEYELAEVVESYERRLQEQVALAKLDVISAVVQQIQMLVSYPIDENDWPDELLQLKECFTEKYEQQIFILKSEHGEEISKLKEEHIRTLNSALERARRRSLRDGDSLTQADIQIIKERDNYKKTTQTLQHLLAELLKYFTQCEDELNNTLVDEIVKNCNVSNITSLSELDIDETTTSSGTITNQSGNVRDDQTMSKRVHLAPDFTDLMQLLDSSTVSSIDSKELSLDLQTCLQRLKQDANNLLLITNNFKMNSEYKNSASKCAGNLKGSNEKQADLLKDNVDVNNSLNPPRNAAHDLNLTSRSVGNLNLSDGNSLKGDISGLKMDLRENQTWDITTQTSYLNLSDNLLSRQSAEHFNSTPPDLRKSDSKLIVDEKDNTNLDTSTKYTVAIIPEKSIIQEASSSNIAPSSKSSNLEERISCLTRQLISESQHRQTLSSDLLEAHQLIKSLESERVHLETSNQHILDKQKALQHDLNIAREKIHELVECGRREIVSEGFGQGERSDVGRYSPVVGGVGVMLELREKLKGMLVDGDGGEMLKVVEEIVALGERIVEEGRRESEDLRQQIDVADKKLKGTSHFLEEQAVERELERDESNKIITKLHEQIKERDKDRINFDRISAENLDATNDLNPCCKAISHEIICTVEQLECQMATMSQIIEANEVRFNEVNIEKQEAIEKVRMLRDIIRNLEAQIDTKSNSESELKELVSQLEILVKQHKVVNDELKHQLDESELSNRDYVEKLEKELKRFRLSSDFAENEGALKQIQLQLHDFELNMDKRIKDLDSFHMALSTCCSSPSEDMSIRDQIRPQTPNSTLDDCDVPLQQLARLKEKLVRHARAEEAAMKKIRDLEMETVNQKHELEELQSERDLLQDQISEQLVLISSLQMRLDEQRMRAEHIKKATNTSLEVRIYDQEAEIQHLQDVINARDKTIRQLSKNFEETKQKLKDREKELGSISEDSNLQKIIDEMKLENSLLQTKISNDAQNSKILPNIVDNILADKNSDIEMLREQLNETQLRLNSFLSLNLDEQQIKNLSNLKSTDRGFSDFLSLISIDQGRKAESKIDSLNATGLGFNRKINETTLFGSRSLNSSEVANLSAGLPPLKQNSTEIHQRSSEKKVHFEEPHIEKIRQENDDLKGKLLDLEEEMKDKELKLEEFALKMQQIDETERKINDLQKSFEDTEENLKRVTETLQEEKNVAEETQKNLRIELAEKKMHLDEKIKDYDLLKQDCLRKDSMYLNLAKEKKDIDARNLELQKANVMFKNVEEIIIDKNKEIYLLEEKLALLGEVKEKMEQLDNALSERDIELADTKENYLSVKDELDEKTTQYKELKDKYQKICTDLKDKEKLNDKFEKELKNKTSQISALTEQLKKAAESYRQQLDGKMNEIETQTNQDRKDLEVKLKELQNVVVDRECELDILKEDVTTYQNDIAKLEAQLKSGKTDDYDLKMMRNRKELAQKDLDIVKLKTCVDDLKKEVAHLQEYLKEKDIIIEQMRSDAKTLQINLETIQSKIQEDGNLVDLRNRLQEEQRVRNNLQDEINHLKTILAAKNENVMTKSIEDITGQVRKQLDYSAHLDSSILNALSNGQDVEELKELLKKEKTTNKELISAKRLLESVSNELERKFEALKVSFSELQQLLDLEKQNCNEIQIEDANLIQQMRIRLEAVMDTENEYEEMLKREKATRQKVEQELISLKSKQSASSNSNSRTDDVTEYKSLPNLTNFELNKLRDDINVLKEENETLKAEIRNYRKDKCEVASNVKYLTDLIVMKKDEIEKLEHRLQKIREDEDSVKEKWMRCKIELEQRNREVDNSRALLEEMEEEIRGYKTEVQTLNDKISEIDENQKMLELEQLEKDRNADLNCTVPEKFVKKMKDLSKLVKEHLEENKILAVTLRNMNDERDKLVNKVRELEENNLKLPFDDPAARVNHLFGRYLRSESFRKSLVWQKRYLIALLATYQSVKPLQNNKISTEHLDKINTKPVRRKLTGIAKFRSISFTIISVLRMQYIVQRWHSGRRFTPHLPYSNYTYQRYITQTHHRTHNFTQPPTQFHLGEPVTASTMLIGEYGQQQQGGVGDILRRGSSRSGGSSTTSREGIVLRTPPGGSKILAGGEICWSGRTPPQKDASGGGSGKKTSNDNDGVPCTSSGIDDNFLPLKTPELVTQCVDRFNSIQQKLGLNS